MSIVGFRIFDVVRPDRALVERFRGVPSSNINDMMNRLYNTDATIKSLNHKTMLGTAITVRAPLGDNMMFHRALDIAQPGDVLVVDGGGCNERSLAGEIMMTYAEKKGLAGVVANGALRDLDGILKLDMPVYATGITPQGPYKNGPGEINVPVCCGGVVVMPGDILVGDLDGIVVIRKEDAPLIIEEALEKLAKEEKKLEAYHLHGIDVDKHSSNWEKKTEQAGVAYVKEARL